MRVYLHFVNNKLSIIPRVNLSSNIGVNGLHARGENSSHFRQYDESFVVKNHPNVIDCNTNFDKYHFKKHIKLQMPWHMRFFLKLKRILKV
jgi:hypothetical protein